MGYIKGNCPKCGANVTEKCNAWVYGSPIRICPHCNQEYFDSRWREVAIDGIEPRSNNAPFYFKGMIAFLLFTVICLLSLLWLITTQKYYPTKAVGCVIVGIIGTLLCTFMWLRIKLGFEEKYNMKYLEESRNRLQDPNYIQKLMDYGYHVPDEYKF